MVILGAGDNGGTMFVYRSKIGLMKIFHDPKIERFALLINDTRYGNYHSAVAAADDVYCHVTGCYDWDLLDGEIMDAPTDIYEWERIR
jgi:hypothetical protein